MTTGQKIYQTIEFFSTEEPHFDRFKTAFRDTLIDIGAPAANAGEMAAIAAETLRDHSDGDYHLGMASIITFHPEFERAIGGDIAVIQAMHKYMSYYLDFAEMQQTRAAS
ncbi:hypothetical protein [Microbulbifer magnicolonia]|uniref:hypothetical protein n=1 Tax=Microbulbifer magnicolonia TaxID=3109744 RepID=UPI002B40C057|nr:hypothetical protein [Microbulbifer sp. GG15]